MIRGLYKQPGGKLVGVSVRLSHARRMEDTHTVECHIDGDFFLDGDEDDTWRMLRSMETALERCASEHAGNPTAMQDAAAIAIEKTMLDHPDARIVGMDAQGIAIAFRRAIDGMTADGDSSAIPASSNGVHGRNYADSEVPRACRQDARRQESRSETDGDRSEYARRWRMLRPRIVHDTPRSPQEQMNVDAAWAREVAEGTREPTLRIWEWAAPAVVIGRFQSLEDEVNVRTAHSEGFQIVRRCTGGGAMFIEPGNTITYSLYAPLDFAHGMSIEESYKLCDHWLVEALRGLGLDVRFAGINDIATQHGKLGGAAQRRFAPVNGGPGAILHHVTLAYDIDAEKMTRVLNVSREKMSDKAVKSAVKRVDPMRSQTGMSRDEVVAWLVAAARRVTI
ncbi:lipoate--protein ligase family protein [Bifidobacterium ruminantium]|uniref:lipoate--protein ligase family protein n=1 Tax=Bifidobacterium ruminantium TaxID=78346 RepID=UPI001956C42C|nr:lipoate--protein ligase family protein [Bifidobacterium ruminantium]MBM6747122.1 lipoate--protein ligase family protein [Bifidobacterium ruminantium]